jgi:hypothetical protein
LSQPNAGSRPGSAQPQQAAAQSTKYANKRKAGLDARMPHVMSETPLLAGVDGGGGLKLGPAELIDPAEAKAVQVIEQHASRFLERGVSRVMRGMALGGA